MGRALTLTRVVPQQVETPVTSFRHGPFRYRFLYARSSECQTAHDPGQDYLTVRQSDEALVFALCDGVSQSFFGELAARFLGDALLDWLWWQWPKVAHSEHAGAALGEFLSGLAERGTRAVMNHPLPAELPGFLRDVLEEKRRHGSESTFACGRIDLAQGQTVFAWMGDSRLRLWSDRGELSAPQDSFLTAQRWSSRWGLVGGVPSLIRPAVPVTRAIAYTDGLSVLDSLQAVPPSAELQHLSDIAGERPDNDDRTLLDIEWGTALSGAPEAPPRRIRVIPLEREMLVTWRPMFGVTAYELELTGDGAPRTWLTERPPMVLNSNGALRLRAWNGKEPGPWSAPAVLLNAKCRKCSRMLQTRSGMFSY